MGPVDSLDHAARLANYGSKMGIDATRKWSTEGFARPWPNEITMDPKIRAQVDAKWKSLSKELASTRTGRIECFPRMDGSCGGGHSARRF